MLLSNDSLFPAATLDSQNEKLSTISQREEAKMSLEVAKLMIKRKRDRFLDMAIMKPR